MKKILLILTILALTFTPAIADWDIKLAVNAGYVAQTVEPTEESSSSSSEYDGDGDTEFNPIVLTGIQFFRMPTSGSIGFGFSLNAAAIVDEEQETPRMTPCALGHVGVPSAQFFAGGCWDPQNGGDNEAVATFGFTASF